MAIAYFDPKTARASVDCGKCFRARFRDMGEVCTSVLLHRFSQSLKLLVLVKESFGWQKKTD